MSKEKTLRSSIGFLVKVMDVQEEVSTAIELTQDVEVIDSEGNRKKFLRGDRIYLNHLQTHYEGLEEAGFVNAAEKIQQIADLDEKRSNNSKGYDVITLRVAILTENKRQREYLAKQQDV